MGDIIGIKCICGSIIHGGHIACLRDCKNLCNHLIVLTQPDNVIKDLKGAYPPVPLEERILILDSIKYVDEVSVYYNKTEDEWLEQFTTHILPQRFPGAKTIMFHSEEYRDVENPPGQSIVDQIVFIPRRYTSTSEIIDKIARGGQWKS